MNARHPTREEFEELEDRLAKVEAYINEDVRRSHKLARGLMKMDGRTEEEIEARIARLPSLGAPEQRAPEEPGKAERDRRGLSVVKPPPP